MALDYYRVLNVSRCVRGSDAEEMKMCRRWRQCRAMGAPRRRVLTLSVRL